MNVELFGLANGMHIIGVAIPDAPLISVQAWVQVGSAYECSNEQGIAHLLEHVLVRHNKHMQLFSCGATIQARTTREATIFSVLVQEQHISTAFHALYQTLSQISADPEDFFYEKAIIRQELLQRQEDYMWCTQEKLFARFWGETSYAHSILGVNETLTALTPEQLLSFHARWYHPQNMFLVLAGDDETFSSSRRLGELFSGMPVFQGDYSRLAALPEAAVIAFSPFSSTHFTAGIAYPDPLKGTTRQAVFELAGRIIAQKTGIRFKRLCLRQGGVCFATFAGHHIQPDQAIDTVLASLIDVAADQLSSEEMASLTNHALREHFKRIERVEDFAALVAEQWMYDRALYSEETLPPFYQQGVPDVIGDLARHCHTLRSARLQPEAAEIIAQQRGRDTRDASNFVRVSRDDMGVELLITHKTSRLFAGTILFPRVWSAETQVEASWSLSHLLIRTWIAHLQQNHLCKQFGIEMHPVVGYDYLGIEFEVLERYWQPVFPVCISTLLQLTFDTELFAQARNVTLRYLEGESRNLFHYGLCTLQKSLFRYIPQYQYTTMDALYAIQNTTIDEITAFHRMMLTQPCVISICGSIPAERITQALLPLHQRRFSIQKNPLPAKFSGNMEKFRIRKAIDSKQALYMLGFTGVSLASVDKYPIHVLWSMLTRKNGRLYQRLRIEQPLAYFFTTYSKEFLQAGYILFYVGCAAHHIDAIKDIICEEIGKISQHKIDDEEVTHAKQALVTDYYRKIQQSTSVATNTAIYAAGYLDPTGMYDYPQQIVDVSQDDLIRVASSYLDLESSVEVCLYPRTSTRDDDSLARLEQDQSSST